MRIIEELLKKMMAVFREDDFDDDPPETATPQRHSTADYEKYEPEVIKKIETLRTSDSPAEKKAASDWIVNTYNDFVRGYVTSKLFGKNKDAYIIDYVVDDLFWPGFLWNATPEKNTGIYKYDLEKAKEGGAKTPFVRFVQSIIDKIFARSDIWKSLEKSRREKPIPQKGDDDDSADFERCIAAPDKPGYFSSDEKYLACKMKNILNKVISGEIESDISPANAKRFMVLHALGTQRPKYIDIVKMFGKVPEKTKAYDAEKEKLDVIEKSLLTKGAKKRDLDKYIQFSTSSEKYAIETLPEIVKSFEELGISQKELENYAQAVRSAEALASEVKTNIHSLWGDLEKSNTTRKVVDLVSSLEGKTLSQRDTIKKDAALLIMKLKELAQGDSTQEFDPLLEHLLRLSKLLEGF